MRAKNTRPTLNIRLNFAQVYFIPRSRLNRLSDRYAIEQRT